MTRRIMFDPDVVIPRESDLSVPNFWYSLINWVEATPGAKIGRASYLHFVSNHDAWISKSSFNPNILNQLLVRVANAIMDETENPRSPSESRHIAEGYKIDDRRDFLILDMKLAPKLGVDLATNMGNWDECGVGIKCDACISADVALILSPGAPPSRILGASAELEVPRFPISECTSCLKDSYGSHYAFDQKTKKWWTRDLENHGGVIFKTYKKEGTSLKFEADRDAEGKIISAKHKGPKKRMISISTLGKCSHPGRHCGRD